MKFIIRAFFLVLILALLGLIPSYYYFNKSLEPIDKNDTSQKLFYINNGSSLTLVLRKLKSDGFIKDYRTARVYTMLKAKNKQIQPGYYQISKSMSFIEIFNKLASGKIYQSFLTIPEGYSMKKIANRISKNGFSGTEYLKLTESINPEYKSEFVFLDKLDKYSSLEGYLFPDTYDITKAKEKDLINSQLNRFEQLIYSEWQKRPKDWKMNLHQTLTLASIVELEAQKPSERTTIAGVFINRLNQGIPLGSDPTVEYALGWHQDAKGLSFKDIEVKSAYNTYKNAGLPPGPISNPGLAVFKAVLNYENTPYLYFVAKGDGSHVFTKTYQEHLHAQSLIVRGLLK
ncbi:MAG: endolytic transglycosylase MltG [Candidatus Sericytochromatia bacterium]